MALTQLGQDKGSVHIQPHELVNGRYLIERLLGRGRMGAVYLATDTLNDDRQVALKTLINIDLSESQLAMLKNEFEVMSSLSHPNLAAVYDFESLQGDDGHFMTMEYVPGVDLETATRGMDFRQALELIVQVCRALAYMHSRSVIHFDLKPANIMVRADGLVKVLDFGLSGARSRVAESGGLIGTPAYLAPELALSPGTADHRVDLYALGIILYRFLANQMPFKVSTISELIKAHCFTPVVFDAETEQKTPGWLRRIVLRMCAKEPADRFRTANAVIEELNRAGGMTYEIETRQTRESYLLSGRFVARSEEFQAVVECVDESLETGYAKHLALFVGGVSGIGKSRLLRQVRHHLQLSRRNFIESNCYEGALSEFGPIIEAVRHIVALMEANNGRDVLGRHSSELATLDGQLAQENGWEAVQASDNPEADRMRTIQHVAEFILDAARVCAFSLYVNDLQWALPGAIDILAQLLRRMSSCRDLGESIKFCLLGSYREDEIDGTPFASLLSAARERNICREIALRPLTKEHVAQLVGSMLGIESPPKAFVQRVHEESGGNPFFIEEIMRILVENGSVFLEHGQWATTEETHSLELPHSVTDALLKRFGLLDKPHRQLLELMAIHGQPMPVGVMQVITGDELTVLQQKLGILMQRRMVVLLSDQDTSYRIVHDRLREAVYDAIPADRRQQLHGALAQGLLDSFQGRHEEILYDLARHCWEAGDDENALTFSLRGAEKASREHANDLGIVLYRRVLALLPHESASFRFDVLERLGELYFLTGAYDNALKCFSDVLVAAQEPLMRARLRRRQALVDLARGKLYDAKDKLWEAAGLLGGERAQGESGYYRSLTKHLLMHLRNRFFPALVSRKLGEAERAKLSELSSIYVRLGYVYYFISPRQVILPVVIGINAGEPLGVSAQLCHTYGFMAVIYATLGFSRSARHYGEAAIAMGRKLGTSYHLGRACSHRGMGLYFMARYDEALIALDQGKRILQDCGDLFELEVCYVHTSYCCLYQGKYKAALESTSEGLRLREESDALQTGKILIIHAAMAKAKLGMMDGTREEMEQAVRLCEQANDMLDLTSFRVFLGDMLLISGQVEDAIECLQIAREIREKHGIIQTYAAGVYAYLVRAYWEKHLRSRGTQDAAMSAGDRRNLRKLSRTALLLGRFGHPNYLSPGWISRGLSLWMDGKTKAARRCFKRGIDVALRQRADMWLAEGCYEAGRCLLLSPATRSEGIGYLQQAEKLFAEQNYLAYLRRTRDILKDINSLP